MTLETIAPLLKCTKCGSRGLAIELAGLSCAACGHSQARAGNNILYDGQATLSPEWQEMQAGSVSRYQAPAYEEDQRVAQLFGGFIAAGLPQDAVVIDIGCGPFGHLPPYIKDLGLSRYVGMEPLTVAVDRDYPCLVGAVAEITPMADASVDAAVFATSLDHIEEVDVAMADIRRVLKPGGRVLVWNGLYEPEALAFGKTFETIFLTGSPLKRAARILAGPLEYAHLGYRMWKRRRMIARGQRLDDAHCRYYTRESSVADLVRWGFTVTRSIVVPGSPSMFLEGRLT